MNNLDKEFDEKFGNYGVIAMSDIRAIETEIKFRLEVKEWVRSREEKLLEEIEEWVKKEIMPKCDTGLCKNSYQHEYRRGNNDAFNWFLFYLKEKRK